MNTSKSLLVVATVAALAAPAAASVAERCSARSLLAAASIGQTNNAKPASDRREVEGLLLRARQAIKDGDFETADALVTRAEKMKLEYSIFHFGDTPKKARADLTSAQRAGKKRPPQRPSEKFTPELKDKPPLAPSTAASQAADGPVAPRVPTEVTDPADEPHIELPQSEGHLTQSVASQRVVAAPEEDLKNVTRLPVAESVIQAPLQSGNAPGTELRMAAPGNGPSGKNNELRQRSDAQLLVARRALAVGDVRRATEAVEAARRLNYPYDHHDDTPQRVDAAIRTYRQVTETTAGRQDAAARHQLADLLMEQASALLRWKEFDEAERLVQHVKSLRVNYGPFESRPEALLEKITAARRQAASPAADARAAQIPAPLSAEGLPDGKRKSYPGAQAVYQADRDVTRNRVSSAAEPAGEADAATTESSEDSPAKNQEPLPSPSDNAALELFRSGQKALEAHDSKTALECFRQAYESRDKLDPATARRLQDFLQMLSAPQPGPRPGGHEDSLIDSTAAKQQLLAKQVSADVAKKEIEANKIREKDPKRAMDQLKEARALVEASGVEPEARKMLLRRVDRKVTELDKYIADNRAKIEQDAANKEVLKEVDRRLQTKIEIDDKLAKLVDDFNKLMDEQRWAEAEVLAKRARELDPENPLVKQLIWQNRFTSRNLRNQNLKEDKEKAVWEALQSVEESSVPPDDREPYVMPDIKKWKDLTDKRAKQIADRRSHRTERELEIERKLKTPVSLKFRNRPLSEVIEKLGKLTAVNLHLDAKGLEEEGVSSDTTVTIDLTQDISLKSALNLILEPLHLSYVIKNEVLMITSEQLRDGEIYPQTYNVADLVIPIPNFAPNSFHGLGPAIMDGYNMSAGGGMGGGPGTAYMASRDGSPATGIINPALLAQMNQLMPGGMGGRTAFGPGQGVGGGQGGVSQAAKPDFDPLIDLITTTIKPQTWDEVGGPGSISAFSNNLSLVISQTEEVHQAIADLLEQLRRNQDLQVTIEVRFITLNDNFFERIGVDFQFNVTNPNAVVPPNGSIPINNLREIVGIDTVGGNSPGLTPQYFGGGGLPFQQSSFNLAVPQFGQPVEVAHFGFAILSDIEAYFLVNAAQGDRRSNVLQAPKVTLFNGQQASVIDQTQTPFVITVIPVVGDFAAAYQPVITVLSEGTALTVQATISHDRRFVRLTVLPFFSSIGDVKEFTFSGTKTSNSSNSASTSTGGTGGDSTASGGSTATTTEGITIQLPSFAVTTVNTTVSVPDGGTVLLGGIKRLSEGRNEFGVPILSKLPYINRLFKNVGIGRETQSLMMMVTPRIIIQEEEEERLGVQVPQSGP